VTEEKALEHGFTCEECAEVYELSDNRNPIRDLKAKITKTEKDLKLIQDEIAGYRQKEEKKRARKEKKDAKVEEERKKVIKEAKAAARKKVAKEKAEDEKKAVKKTSKKAVKKASKKK
jgi:hypothetical protein